MLKEGDTLPTFSLPADDGTSVSSASLGTGKAVLYFYPRDSTPGCTRESQAFSASLAQFKKAGVKVYGISRDSLASHTKFRRSYALTVPLLSDPELTVHKAFGAWGEKTMYGKKVEGVLRSTFVVEGGKITRVWPSVKVDGHAEAVLAFVAGAAPAPAAKAPAAKAPAKKAAPKKASTKTPPRATTRGKKTVKKPAPTRAKRK
jgi:peroxiredoxin Q/BCP